MEDFTLTLTPAMMAIVPVVAILTQFTKRLEFINKNKAWLPFLSIAIALGVGYATSIPDPIPASILIGLVSSGSYDAVKAISTK